MELEETGSSKGSTKKSSEESTGSARSKAKKEPKPSSDYGSTTSTKERQHI